MSKSDDLELFLAEMSDVKRMKSDDKIYEQSQQLTPTEAQLARQEAAQKEEACDPNYLSMEYVDLIDPYDIIGYKKDGVQEGVYKKLRLGQYQVDSTLNLFGQPLADARRSIFNFLTECYQRNIRTILIQHGMGKQTKPHPGLMKSYVNKWLQEMPEVLAFHSAQKHHGGLGAVYVLLRKSEEKKRENRERHASRRK
ncbi:DNA endonuclease SmrA [Algicola sagamiensis]|uniref:DNA endonuclease SmrA n=1 Tax=Algicola sagamiensis TaxID=163869 RepID=UPI000379C546|nr:DNA endonuclease SmrA [Algicola sagamiensis]